MQTSNATNEGCLFFALRVQLQKKVLQCMCCMQCNVLDQQNFAVGLTADSDQQSNIRTDGRMDSAMTDPRSYIRIDGQ